MSIFVATARRLDRLPFGPALFLGVVVGGGAVFLMRQMDWPLGAVVLGPVMLLAVWVFVVWVRFPPSLDHWTLVFLSPWSVHKILWSVDKIQNPRFC